MQKLEIHPSLKDFLLKRHSSGSDFETSQAPEPPQRKRRSSFPFIYVSNPHTAFNVNSGGNNVFVSAGSYSWSPNESSDKDGKE